MKKAKIQYEVLPIWSNWAEWMSTRLAPNSHHKWIATAYCPIQHVRSKSLQKTYPRKSRNHLLLLFRKVLDTYCNNPFFQNFMVIRQNTKHTSWKHYFLHHIIIHITACRTNGFSCKTAFNGDIRNVFCLRFMYQLLINFLSPLPFQVNKEKRPFAQKIGFWVAGVFILLLVSIGITKHTMRDVPSFLKRYFLIDSNANLIFFNTKNGRQMMNEQKIEFWCHFLRTQTRKK